MSIRFTLLFTIFFACNPPANMQETQHAKQYIEQVLLSRKLKDHEFATSAQSPFGAINPDFKGLNYFEPNPVYRVKYSLQKTSPVDANIMDTKGEKRTYRDMGTIVFNIAGKEYTLHVFNDGKEKNYFIPFKDLSNGKTTYKGGRYIEINAEHSEGIIDFNQAYNPYCHYNHKFSCPLVPAVNTLSVDITAGEKKYD